MKAWPVDTSPISALMASIAILGFSDRTVDNDSIEEHEERAVRLIATHSLSNGRLGPCTAWPRNCVPL